MFDVDHFKDINDQHGHTAGDRKLISIVKRCQDNIRAGDRFIRWGGEEFVVLLQNTRLQEAEVIAEKLRRSLDEGNWADDIPVTASFGVATSSASDTATTLLQRADLAVYRAKQGGRNLVRVESALA